jgi:hypothetical protein
MIVAHITKIEVFSGGLWMLGNTDENPHAYRCYPSAMMASSCDTERVV